MRLLCVIRVEYVVRRISVLPSCLALNQVANNISQFHAPGNIYHNVTRIRAPQVTSKRDKPLQHPVRLVARCNRWIEGDPNRSISGF